MTYDKKNDRSVFWISISKDINGQWILRYCKSATTICVDCKEDFPYAEPVIDFKCYKCSNGL